MGTESLYTTLLSVIVLQCNNKILKKYLIFKMSFYRNIGCEKVVYDESLRQIVLFVHKHRLIN